MTRSCIQINVNEQCVFQKIIQEVLRSEINGHWYFLFISGVLKRGNMLPLEEDVESSMYGKKVDNDFLLNLSKDVHDLHDLLLISTDTENVSLTYKSPIEELYNLPLLMIELFDSTYWRVCSSNKDFIQKLKMIFGDKCRSV